MVHSAWVVIVYIWQPLSLTVVLAMRDGALAISIQYPRHGATWMTAIHDSMEVCLFDTT